MSVHPAPKGNVFPLRRNASGEPTAGSTGAHGTPPPEAQAGHEKSPSALTQAQERAAHRRKVWLRETMVITACYALNGALITLFSLTGTVPWMAGLLYAVPGMVSCAFVAWLIGNGRSARFADASLSWVHSLTSIALCLLCVSLFPQLAFAYALMLFTVFLTATYRMTKRQVQAMLLVVTLLFGLLTLGLGRQLQIPQDSPGDQLVAWLFFLVTLGSCVVLSVINTRSNRLLRDRGQQMAATLAQIERLAHHDELTGVLNRRRLLNILAEEIAHTERSGTPLSVALFDLDHFKAVNDTLGHLTGDRVLKQFTTAAQAQARSTDRFGRYGGEEFLTILTGADLTQAEHAVDRTRDTLAQVDWSPIAAGLRITFSAGVATHATGDSAETLLARADHGLYAAKHAGRNCTRAA